MIVALTAQSHPALAGEIDCNGTATFTCTTDNTGPSSPAVNFGALFTTLTNEALVGDNAFGNTIFSATVNTDVYYNSATQLYTYVYNVIVSNGAPIAFTVGDATGADPFLVSNGQLGWINQSCAAPCISAVNSPTSQILQEDPSGLDDDSLNHGSGIGVGKGNILRPVVPRAQSGKLQRH